MYSRDAHPAYSSHANARILTFRLSLSGGAGAPTIDYGSNWISSIGAPSGASKNNMTLTLKDSIFDVLDSSVNLRDAATPNGRYVTIGNFANEQSSSALTATISSFSAGGAALDLTTLPAGTKITGTLTINNGNVTTPGGN